MSAAAEAPPPTTPSVDIKPLRDSVNDTPKHFVTRSATLLFVTFFIAVARGRVCSDPTASARPHLSGPELV